MKTVDLQSAYDDPNGYHYACYDCEIVGPDKGTYGSGSLYMRNEMDVVAHLKDHIRRGHHVENDKIEAFVKFFRRDLHIHQSLSNPNRRTDAHTQGRRETAFFEQWLHEQDSRLALQMLDGWGIKDETHREVRIMASLIQWLGTNVGFCFLEMALKRCGYKIVKDSES